MADTPFNPVLFDVQKELSTALQDPAFQAAYDALADEFSTLDALLQARRAAGLTQVQVAERMGIKQSALARIESSLGSKKHSPSLATLRKYAEACGKRLEIRLV